MPETKTPLERALKLPGPGPSRAVVYAEAIAALVVALIVSILLADQIAGTRLLFLWVASAYVAWRGGFRPVAFVSLTSVLLWDFFLREPTGEFSMLTGPEVL